MTSPGPAPRRRVCIESPLSGDIVRNVKYAEALMLNALQSNEAPFLGHLLYPRVLDDTDATHREMGIEAHLTWLLSAEYVVIGMDLGEPTKGIQRAIDVAEKYDLPCVPRWLGIKWEEDFDRSKRATAGYDQAEASLLSRLAASLDALASALVTPNQPGRQRLRTFRRSR